MCSGRRAFSPIVFFTYVRLMKLFHYFAQLLCSFYALHYFSMQCVLRLFIICTFCGVKNESEGGRLGGMDGGKRGEQDEGETRKGRGRKKRGELVCSFAASISCSSNLCCHFAGSDFEVKHAPI